MDIVMAVLPCEAWREAILVDEGCRASLSRGRCLLRAKFGAKRLPRGRGLGRLFAGHASAAGLRCGGARFWFRVLRRWRGDVPVLRTVIAALSGAGLQYWRRFQHRHVFAVRSSAFSHQFMWCACTHRMICQQSRLGCQRCDAIGDAVVWGELVIVRGVIYVVAMQSPSVSNATYDLERQTKNCR